MGRWMPDVRKGECGTLNGFLSLSVRIVGGKVANIGDYPYMALLKMADGKYPELFDTFQVKSRQRVLRTFLYKAKANIMENQPTTESIVDVLEAYNNIRRQLNVIVNSQLDKKLILDEG